MKRSYCPKRAADVAAASAAYLLLRLDDWRGRRIDSATLHAELTLIFEGMIWAYFDIPSLETPSLPVPSLN